MPLNILVIADPAAPYLAPLAKVSNVAFTIANDPAQLAAAAPDADVIFYASAQGTPLGPILPHATRARWIHSLWTGVEKLVGPELIAHPAPFSNGKGVFRGPLGDWVVAMMLYFSFDFPRVLRQQAAGVWEHFTSKSIAGQTLGIVGYGGLGSGAAERARMFGMKIEALRRSSGYSPAQLNQLMAISDFVLLATPLTPETRGMIGKEQIAAMKRSAVLINIGRGAVVDEDALVAALESGQIRGAALDVFTVEPLPKGHPFYRLPNVFLSPHTADRVEGFVEPAMQCFLDNLERFRKGEPIQNVVDKHAGY